MAHADTNLWSVVTTNQPHWRFVERPQEWPHEPDGSNELVRCVSFAEKETAKAELFLATGHYYVIQGGLKNDVPHVIVEYPGMPKYKWTIFFTLPDKKPYSIERRTETNVDYLIMLDPRSKLATTLHSKDFNLFCNPPGKISGFARPIRDKLSYTVGWDDTGHITTEAVYDWALRGKPVK